MNSEGWVTPITGGTALISYSLGGAVDTELIVVVPRIPPVITSVSPLVGYSSSAVTIRGVNFNDTAANNIVFFGAAKASITSAADTLLNVILPTGATMGPVTVIDTAGCMAADYSKPFNPVCNTSLFVPGINFTLRDSFATTTRLPIYDTVTVFAGLTNTDVVISDINGDGKDDIVALAYSSTASFFSVYANASRSGSLSEGSFTKYVTSIHPRTGSGLAVRDFDNDGRPDVIVIDSVGASMLLFKNTSSGGTVSLVNSGIINLSGNPTSIDVADFDKDGKPDLAIAMPSSAAVYIYKNISRKDGLDGNSFVSSTYVTSYPHRTVKCQDIDGDGKIDIVAANYWSNNITLYQNLSTGGMAFGSPVTFSVSPYVGPRSIACADFDGDGKTDIVIGNAQSHILSIFRNTGTVGTIYSGTLATAVVSSIYGLFPNSLAVSDLDVDGKPDLVCAYRNSNNLSILKNASTTGSINLPMYTTIATGSSPFGVAIADMDSNGSPEIVVSNAGNWYVNLFRNNLLQRISGGGILRCGHSRTLNAPSAGGSWSTSAAGIATISGSGVVSAISSGTAIISYTLGAYVDTELITVTGYPATITSATPVTGYPAATVTLRGSNFNDTAANDIVYFGAVRASVATANDTLLTVVVPAGATFSPITVLDSAGCYSAATPKSFLASYSTAGYLSGLNISNAVNITASGSPRGVALGDIDGDGKTDLVVANSTANNAFVYRNISVSGAISTGSFASPVTITTGTTPSGVVIADMDNDGKLDIAISNNGSSDISLFKNQSTSGTINLASGVAIGTAANPLGIDAADLDKDGRTDIVVATPSMVIVMRNITSKNVINSGSFTSVTGLSVGSTCYFVKCGDIDGDGKPDVLATNYASNTLLAFRNTSSIGSFSFGSPASFSTSGFPAGISIADMDGDGKNDVVVCNLIGSIGVYRNTSSVGSVTLAAPGSFSVSSPQFSDIGDLDGDGKPDVVTANTAGSVSVFRNTSTSGSIALSTPNYFTAGTTTYWLSVGDLDNDGKSDIVATNNGSGNISVFRNTPLRSISGGGVIRCERVMTAPTPGGVWSSSNSSVALINPSGVVTATGIGTAIISYSGGTMVDTELITVVPSLPPVLTGVSPLTSYTGTSVTIRGSNFNDTATNNIVYFGATRASIASATDTSIVATVPNGSAFAPVTIFDSIGCLSAWAPKPFLPGYNNSGIPSGSVNFAAPFGLSTGTAPRGSAMCDLDGDGQPDLITVNATTNNVTVYRRVASGATFNTSSYTSAATLTTANQPSSVHFADLDMDGKPELVVTATGSNLISVYKNNSAAGSIAMSGPTYYSVPATPVGIDISDLDKDGKPDIAVASATSVAVLRNLGVKGYFSFASAQTYSAGTACSYIKCADIDHDGKPDLVATNNGSNTVNVYRNTSTPGTINSGSFATPVSFATGSGPLGVVCADFDGDTKTDIAVVNATANNVSVLRNTTTSATITMATAYTAGTGTSPREIGVGDIDGDSKADIVTSNNGSANISVIRNTSSSGSVSMATKVDFSVGTSPYGIVVGDLDNDGKADVATTANGINYLVLFRNIPLAQISGGGVIANACLRQMTAPSSGGTWSSSNAAVASVSSLGYVLGLTAGTTIISYSLGTYTDTELITVVPYPVATISGLSVPTANTGAAITIRGRNFNDTATNNLVYFGTAKATITSASDTLITALLPPAATFAHVTVTDTVGCQQVAAPQPFLPSFDHQRSFGLHLDSQAVFTTNATPGGMTLSDMDGDGKADLVVTNVSTGNLSIHRNIATSGALNASSFAAAITVTLGAGTSPSSVKFGDLDGDGKLDLLVMINSGVFIVKNTSTAGAITTGTPFFVSTPSSPSAVNIADIDKDGRPDIVAANGSQVSVIKNTASKGVLVASNFATPVSFATGSACSMVSCTDIDGDGKPEIVSNAAINLCVLRNTSTPGIINSGSFATAVNYSLPLSFVPTIVACSDFNSDGKTDIVLSFSTNPSILFFKNTSTTGTINSSSLTYATGFGAVGLVKEISIADFNGDGRPDFTYSTSNIDSTVVVVRNTNNDTTIAFSDYVIYKAGRQNWGVSAGDLDGDGRADVAVANYGSNTVSLLRNKPLELTGGGTWRCSGTYPPLHTNVPGGNWSDDPIYRTTHCAVVSSTGDLTIHEGTPTYIRYYFGSSTNPTAWATDTIFANLHVSPVITNITPAAGYPSSVVQIKGHDFNDTTANESVFFGAVRATVLSATDTQLSVQVPFGATYGPITVSNMSECGLMATSKSAYLPGYNNTGKAPGICQLPATAVGRGLGSGFAKTAVADLDGDGKIDIVSLDSPQNCVYIYRNLSATGVLNASSFSIPDTIRTLTRPNAFTIADMNGDGTKDIVVASSVRDTVFTYINSSVPGSMRFAAEFIIYPFSFFTEYLIANQYRFSGGVNLIRVTNAWQVLDVPEASVINRYRGTARTNPVIFEDLDSDGKLDLVVIAQYNDTLFLIKPLLYAGMSAYADRYPIPYGCTDAKSADIDGDGLKDLVLVNGNTNKLYIIRNTLGRSSSYPSLCGFSLDTFQQFNLPATPTTVEIADMDGDGKPDVIANCGYLVSLRNLSTSGHISMSPYGYLTNSTVGPYYSIADIDNDGYSDIVGVSDSIRVFKYQPMYADMTGGGIIQCIGGQRTMSTPTGALMGAWMSGNTSVATVNPNTGIVTALSAGTASISYVSGCAVDTELISVIPSQGVIASITPLAANPGATLTIRGSNFNDTLSNNIVWLGGQKANITAGNDSILSVAVPLSATYAPVTLVDTGRNCKLQAISNQFFMPGFDNSSYVSTSVGFAAQAGIAWSGGIGKIVFADIDGDRKPDIIAQNTSSVSVFRNVSTTGSISASSFAAPVDFSAGSVLLGMDVGDMDGDGRLDLVVAGSTATGNQASLFRSTSVPGAINASSMATRLDYTLPLRAQNLSVGDVDCDGKPDIVIPMGSYGTNAIMILWNKSINANLDTSSFGRVTIPMGTTVLPTDVSVGDIDGDGLRDLVFIANGMGVMRNTGTRGNISPGSFAAPVYFNTGGNPKSLKIADVDGDRKQDIVVANGIGSSSSIPGSMAILRNTATSGSISSGTFAAAVNYYSIQDPYNFTMADINADGKPDIAISDWDGSRYSSTSLAIMRNNCTTGGVDSASFSVSKSRVRSYLVSLFDADINGDGFPEIAGYNGSDSLQVYKLINQLKPPVITALQPQSAKPGDTIVIRGGNFNPVPTNNLVQLGAVKATVISSFDTVITAIVPSGATFECISVSDSSRGGVGYSNVAYLPKFNDSGFSGHISLDNPISFSTITSNQLTVNDLDRDGKPDVIAGLTSSSTMAIHRNTTSGSISSSSLASYFSTSASGTGLAELRDIDIDGKADLNTMSTTPLLRRNTSTTGSVSFGSLINFLVDGQTLRKVADFDGDGKLDYLINNGATSAILQNNFRKAAIDILSFGSPINLAVNFPVGTQFADLNGDNKPDAIVLNSGSNLFTTYRYQSQLGNITPWLFAAGTNVSTSAHSSSLVLGDLDGDNLPEVVVAHNGGTDSTITVYRNTSSASAISFATGIDIVAGKSPSVLTLGDINGDGKADIVSFNNGDSTITTLYNRSATGSFSFEQLSVLAHSTHPVLSLAIADLEGDGPPEIISLIGATTTINVYKNKPLPQITGGRNVCRGLTDTLANSRAGGVWSSSDTLTARVSASGVVTGIAGGTAIISYAIGSTWDTAQVVVVSPSGSIAPSAPFVCVGGGRTLTASGAGSYSWSPAAGLSATTGSTVTASPAVTTTYVAYGPAAGGCWVYDTVTVTAAMPPHAAIAMVAVPCVGYATTLVFSGVAGDTISYAIDSGTYVDALLGLAGTDTLVTGPTTGMHTYLLHNVRNSGCAVTLDTTATVTSLQMTWAGTTSTDWNTAANWNCGAIPVVTDNVLIPAGTTYAPVIAPGANGYAHNLSVAGGVTINNKGLLTVSGDLTLNGTVGDTGTTRMAGATMQTVHGTGSLSRLLIENSSGVGLDTGSRLTITSTLGINTGVLTTNDSLYLYSDSLGTARVAALPSGTSVSGNVRVMQYIPGGMRRYRFWSHPFTSAIGLEQMQQYIDVTGTGGAANGFTTTTANSPSAFRYDPFTGNSSLGYDPGWKPFTSTYTTADSNRLHRYQGIRVYMRGRKGEGLGYGSYTPSATTITQFGPLNQGRQVITLNKGTTANQDYNMVGNPYAAPVDIGTACYNARVSGNVAGGAFYVWNPGLGAAGQFQAIAINTVTVTPYYLPANNCFQVRAAHNGDSVVVNEADKGIAASAPLFKQSGEGVRLMVYDAKYHPYDVLDFNFNEQAGDEDDNANDAHKLNGPDFNFYSLSSDNRKLAIDVRSFRPESRIPLGVSSNLKQDFIIKAESVHLANSQTLYLHDKLLNQFVWLQSGTEYRFSVSNDSKTQGDNRFELGMAPESAAQQSLVVWMDPNPATEQVTVNWMNHRLEAVSIRLLDMSGVCVYSKKTGNQQNGAQYINIDKLASGIYLMELTAGNEKVVLRLVKK